MYRSVDRSGFSLVELLVVLAIIGVLSAVLYASFSSSRELVRDSKRQTDLGQLQLALEVYKAQYGRYPAEGCGNGATWTGPGPHSPWGNDCDDYIEGLVPDFIAQLPTDPIDEMEFNRGFLYRTNTAGSAYKVLVHSSVESKIITSHEDEFARCPEDCGSASCGTDPQRKTYAVYSRGAECW